VFEKSEERNTKKNEGRRAGRGGYLLSEPSASFALAAAAAAEVSSRCVAQGGREVVRLRIEERRTDGSESGWSGALYLPHEEKLELVGLFGGQRFDELGQFLCSIQHNTRVSLWVQSTQK
jgi:hypothetical protein